MNDIPAFFECQNPTCGWFHPVGYDGPCTDEENLYGLDLLDEKFGPDGWVEVDPPVQTEPLNLRRLKQLRPDVDLHGNKLEVGCNVRIYHAASYDPDKDSINDIALTPESGTVTDGILLEIGVEDGDRRCYRIKCTRYDSPRIDRGVFNQTGELRYTGRAISNTDDELLITVNGDETLAVMKPSTVVRNGNTIDQDRRCPAFYVFRR